MESTELAVTARLGKLKWKDSYGLEDWEFLLIWSQLGVEWTPLIP
jgi:hypothetical protein